MENIYYNYLFTDFQDAFLGNMFYFNIITQ